MQILLYTDHCSSLSVTSGVLSHWRVFERARSLSLVTHTIFATIIQ